MVVLRLLFLSSFLALFAGCSYWTSTPVAASYETVPGSGGSVMRAFTCSDSLAACFKRATLICPEGYDVEGVSAPGHVYFRRHHGRYEVPGQVVVTCNRDRPEVVARCGEAWGSHYAVAKWWAQRREGSFPRSEQDEDQFTRICGTLPAAMQKCLVPSYRQFHEERCEHATRALAPLNQELLDLALLSDVPSSRPEAASQ